MFPPDSVRKLCQALAEDLDWNDPAFDLNKACYCSLFAHAVYKDLPEFELKKAQRIAVVPCTDYLEQLALGETSSVEQYLLQTDLGPVFVIRQRLAIIAGIKTPDVVIVAIRGTQTLYDLVAVDIDARFRFLKCDHAKATFHRGFLYAAAKSATALYAKLTPYINQVPIYLTGHSLGGAIAAVYNAVFPSANKARKPASFNNNNPIQPISCYTFGMPRYGHGTAIRRFPYPHPIFNPGDLVPDVPPTGLLYENCPIEYCLSSTGLQTVTARPDQEWSPYQVAAQFRSGLQNHNMELYVDLIFKSLQQEP
jgi:hypothetical protein